MSNAEEQNSNVRYDDAEVYVIGSGHRQGGDNGGGGNKQRWRWLALLLTAVAVGLVVAFVFRQGGDDSNATVPLTESAADTIGKQEQPDDGTTEQTLSPVVVSTDKTTYDVADVMPEYPGGMKALIDFLSQNVSYPAEAKQRGEQGRVIVSFVVDATGTVCEATVKRSVTPTLDEEALRVVRAMPRWKPGTVDGQPVRVRFSIPISFQLK